MLHFSNLFCQIADALQLGQVSFDTDLNVIAMTSAARTMIYPEARIDSALTKGTDGAIRDKWTDMLGMSLQANQKALFRNVPYHKDAGRQILDITCIPVCSEPDARVVGGVVTLMDVTGAIDNKQPTTQSERLMAVGRVAGKVAHELNNPLDGILRYANLSLRMLEQGQAEKAAEYIQHCRGGLQRMAQIITEMLEFSRSSHFTAETSPVDKLLEDALKAMDANLKSVDVQLVRTAGGPLPHYKSDALYQVFCNLIKNAADAMEGKGKLTITLSRNETDLRIDFLDSGPGFGAHLPEELFRPFFTTKPPGRGTGLGLSICRDILEKFGGRLSACNVPEGGACFTVQLPVLHTPSIRS